MRLDCSRFFGLGQNFKQIVIWQEIKSCELFSLFLQIFVQWLLDILQLLICFLEFSQQSFSTAHIHDFDFLLCQINVSFPDVIHLSELFTLGWKLLWDISGIKNWLEIHPIGLAFHPLFHDIWDHFKFTVPCYDLIFERFFKGTKLNDLSVDQMFI